MAYDLKRPSKLCIFVWLLYAFCVLMIGFELWAAIVISPWYYTTLAYFIGLTLWMIHSHRKYHRRMEEINEKIRVSQARIEELLKEIYEDPTDPWSW